MNIYFWNINNSLISYELAKKTVTQENQSIFIISEFWEILDQIHRTERNFVHDEINKRVGILCNDSYKVKYRDSSEFYLITTLNFNSIEIVICSVHFRSKRNGEVVQKRIIERTIDEINVALKKFDTNNKVVIGDFNINPYDDSMINIYNFNSVSSLNHRTKMHKTYREIDYDIYYNPFFSYQGDLSIGPPGTYFYEKETQTHSWYIFDQALINSKFLENIDTQECNVLEKLNDTNLCLDNGKPNNRYSDHLPIKIKIK